MKKLAVLGMGVVGEGYASLRELGVDVAVIDPAEVASQDLLAQLAIGAVHQAWGMAKLAELDAERIGLIYVSAWGMIEATVGYLESMLDQDGRYASPRHFSRSVYSSGASALAIHFGFHGPCETLSFDADAARGAGAVQGALLQAWRLLETRRCDRVIVVWADERHEAAEELTQRAAVREGQKEYRRYAEQGLGQGAVAVVVGREGGLEIRLPVKESVLAATPMRGKPYPMDAAVSLVEWLVQGIG